MKIIAWDIIIMVYGNRWQPHLLWWAKVMYRIVESLSYTPETNMTLYFNYTLIIINKLVRNSMSIY